MTSAEAAAKALRVGTKSWLPHSDSLQETRRAVVLCGLHVESTWCQ